MPFEPTQAVTPEIALWLAQQAQRGESPAAMVEAMLRAGWDLPSSEYAVDLLGKTGTPVTVPALAVPLASGNMVDAGDKWVEVTYRSAQPDITVFGNLLSDSECDALMDAARPRLARSLTVDEQTGGDELNPGRTSRGTFLRRGESQLVHQIEARISRLFGWPAEKGEDLQILHYSPGDEYRPHYDYFDPAEPGTATILQRGGQRVATLIMYLHSPEKGGATVFPMAGISVAPQRGTAVFFSYPVPMPSSLSLHGGEPVTAGEKWVATKWMREREFL
jgi:prolyl 4-hydroxylase